MIIKEFKGLKPILKDVYLAENCSIIGDVTCEKDVSIWYGAVLRGDAGSITIKEGSNIQDNCVIHVGFNHPVYIDKHVSIGHSAVVHGCTIGENTLIGMHATLVDGCIIGKNCIIGAHSLVTSNKIIPDNSIVMGSPARVVKEMTEDMIKNNKENALHYIELSREELEKI